MNPLAHSNEIEPLPVNKAKLEHLNKKIGSNCFSEETKNESYLNSPTKKRTGADEFRPSGNIYGGDDQTSKAPSNAKKQDATKTKHLTGQLSF